jgi:multiple sugar transport system ATP-binding protein
MATISFRGVHKVYSEGTHAVRDLDLEVHEGELLVLLGPSGCGKTTVLRLLAGLELPTRGEIYVGDRRVDGLAADARDVAMIFQSYALYPHMTVRQNMAFPLRMRRATPPERERRVREVAEMLDLTLLLDKRPGQLSGGQQQRVAIARALVREPAAFLMDEPLSNLDAQLRTRIRAELGTLQRRLSITTLFVTHDQTEAMTLGHRVAVLRDGHLQQVGTPDELYRRPANVFVAGFVGQPAMNLVSGSIVDEGEGYRLRLDGTEAATIMPEPFTVSDVARTDRVCIGWRAEALDLCASGSADALYEGTVRVVESLGPERLVHVETRLKGWERAREAEPGATVIVRTPSDRRAPRVDEGVGIRVRREATHVFGVDGRSLRLP